MSCRVFLAHKFVLLPGAARRAGYLSCFAKKGNPKKATPFRRPPLRCGFPSLLAKPGCCGTRAMRSDSPRRNPPGLAALLGGGSGES